MIKKTYIFEKLIFFFIILSFIVGFFFKENSSGGGELDHWPVLNNVILFKNYSFFEINWKNYISSSLPIFYIVTKYLIPSNDIFFYLSITTFILSISVIIIFFKILSIKSDQNLYDWNLAFLSIIPLISPYFRTSAFWGLEENIGYLFFLSSIFFYLKSENQKKNKFILIFCSVFFACCSFYARQNYAFISIIIFFQYFNFKKILCNENFFISITFAFLLAPSLYFFLQWGGLDPMGGARVQLKIENILIIFTNFFLYLFPFLLIYDFKKNIKINIINKKIIVLFLFIIFIFILFFFNHISKESLYYSQNIGGGMIYKIIFKKNLFFNIFELQKIIYILIAFCGLILIILFSFNNRNFFIFSLFTILVFSFVDNIFQEYFDPLIFFSVFLFTNIIKSEKLKIYKFFLFFYFFLIFSAAFIIKVIV